MSRDLKHSYEGKYSRGLITSEDLPLKVSKGITKRNIKNAKFNKKIEKYKNYLELQEDE